MEGELCIRLVTYARANICFQSHRTVLRPFLSRVRDVELAIFENHVQDLLKVLPKNGTTVDIQPVFASFTLDVSTNVFLGTSTNLLSSSDADQTEGQEFAKAFDHAQRNLVGLGDSSVLTTVGELLTGHRLLHQSLDTVNKFVDKILDRSLQQREITSEQESLDQPHDESLLDTLLRTGRSRIDVKQDIINLVVAGKDSTAAYLSSIWYMLSKYPDVYQKLRDEIGILENKPPTKEDLHRFPYLQMVLQEGKSEALQRTTPFQICTCQRR
jgi:cytochrome P450